MNGGSLFGGGTLGDNVVDDSILSPGDSVASTGKLTVADTYTQGSTGALDIEINGATAGTKYDQLKVTQGATLGGTLNITLGGFTPTVGQTFTILTASSRGQHHFATVNGLAINGSEHFTITYNAGSVVLKVVAGPAPSSNSDATLTTHLIRPILRPGMINRGSVGKGRFGLAISAPQAAPAPLASMLHAAVNLRPTFRLAQVPQAGMLRTAPVSMPGSFAPFAMGARSFRPRDEFGSVAAPAAPADASAAGTMGFSAVSASAYNGMGAMNHMRFEAGVDLKALLKTNRKQLVRALWASPDSPEALSIGYMHFIGSH